MAGRGFENVFRAEGVCLSVFLERRRLDSPGDVIDAPRSLAPPIQRLGIVKITFDPLNPHRCHTAAVCTRTNQRPDMITPLNQCPAQMGSHESIRTG